MANSICQRDLRALQALAFKRLNLSRLLSRTGTSQTAFHLHILAIERPHAIAYNRLMCTYAGNPAGIECQHRSGASRWAFVLPDVDSERTGTWRVQYFDLDGFQSHHCEPTMPDAVNCMISDGFINPSPGALDQISATPRWKRGVEVASLVFKLNTRAISYAEFSELIAALGTA